MSNQFLIPLGIHKKTKTLRYDLVKVRLHLCNHVGRFRSALARARPPATVQMASFFKRNLQNGGGSKDWFEKLLGFREGGSMSEVQSKLQLQVGVGVA